MEFNITTSMSQVRDAVTDTDILKAVSPILADVERNFINLQDAKKTVDSESKGRKLEIRDDLKPKIEKFEDEAIKLQKQIDDLKDDNNSETLKTENKELLGFKTKVLTDRRISFVDGFVKIAGDEKFIKVKGEFILPKQDGDEKDIDYTKIDFKDISEEDMDKNVTALDRLTRIEYFGTPEKTLDTAGGTHTKTQTADAMAKEIEKAKTHEDIIQIQKKYGVEKK